MHYFFKINLFLVCLFLFGCDNLQTRAGAIGDLNLFADDVTRARAVLEPKSGSKVSGVVTMTQEKKRIILVAKVMGLKPNSEHGFHIHQMGDCSAPDASSAGSHFNPYISDHGRMQENPHHLGDLINISADADGNADYQIALEDVSLRPGKTSIIGRALVIHEEPDDYVTQPSGNSGKRIACGVIK